MLLLSVLSFAQELRCNVLVDASRIQSQETQIFEELKVSIEEFMNTTRWTEDEYEDLERIDCNLSFFRGGVDTSGTAIGTHAQIGIICKTFVNIC